MTASYDRFLRQYHAQGREKADGYGSDCFTDLTSDERAEVIAKLREELVVDPLNATWLYLLDPAGAEAACLDALASGRAREPAVLLQTLAIRTGDPAYQRRLIAEYPTRARDKQLTIRCAAGTQKTPALLAFVQHVVLTETDPRVLRTATMSLLLDLHAVPRRTPEQEREFARCVAVLEQSGSEDKRECFARLLRDFPLPHETAP